MVNVDFNVYEPFYKKLMAVFVERELKDLQLTENEKKSPNVWDKQKKDGTYYIQSLIGGVRDNTRIFSKLKTEIKLRPETTDFKDELLCRAVQYIGIKPPEGMVNFHLLETDKQAQVLWEQFRLELEKEELPTKKNQNSPIDLVNELISEFYSNISEQKYREAWELMTPDFQNRKYWYGNFDKFRGGYVNTMTADDLHIFNHRQTVSKNSMVCTIFFHDKVFAYSTQELKIIETLKVKHLDAFVKHVNSLKENLEEKGLKGFDEIELCKLFEPAASEYIWFTRDFDHTKLDELFDIPRTSLYIKRLYDCTCMLQGSKWLIHSISPMKSFSAR